MESSKFPYNSSFNGMKISGDICNNLPSYVVKKDNCEITVYSNGKVHSGSVVLRNGTKEIKFCRKGFNKQKNSIEEYLPFDDFEKIIKNINGYEISRLNGLVCMHAEALAELR